MSQLNELGKGAYGRVLAGNALLYYHNKGFVIRKNRNSDVRHHTLRCDGKVGTVIVPVDELNVLAQTAAFKQLTTGSLTDLVDELKNYDTLYKILMADVRMDTSILMQEYNLTTFQICGRGYNNIRSLIPFAICDDTAETVLKNLFKRNVSVRGLCHELYMLTTTFCMFSDSIHKRSMVHCDIKLENILYKSASRGDTYRIGDYGILCRAEQLGVCGTPLFMTMLFKHPRHNRAWIDLLNQKRQHWIATGKGSELKVLDRLRAAWNKVTRLAYFRLCDFHAMGHSLMFLADSAPDQLKKCIYGFASVFFVVNSTDTGMSLITALGTVYKSFVPNAAAISFPWSQDSDQGMPAIASVNPRPPEQRPVINNVPQPPKAAEQAYVNKVAEYAHKFVAERRKAPPPAVPAAPRAGNRLWPGNPRPAVPAAPRAGNKLLLPKRQVLEGQLAKQERELQMMAERRRAAARDAANMFREAAKARVPLKGGSGDDITQQMPWDAVVQDLVMRIVTKSVTQLTRDDGGIALSDAVEDISRHVDMHKAFCIPNNDLDGMYYSDSDDPDFKQLVRMVGAETARDMLNDGFVYWIDSLGLSLYPGAWTDGSTVTVSHLE